MPSIAARMTVRPSMPPATSDSRLPRYLQIRDALLHRILARAWTEGQALPAEDKLAAEFDVSLGTLRKALEVLVADSIIERIHGRGTFVSRAYERISMLRYVDYSLAHQHEMPAAATLKLEVQAASSPVRDRLGLSARDKVLYLHRSRSADDEVLLSEHVWLPYRLFAKLENFLAHTTPALLYPAYDSVCGVLVSHATDTVTTASLPAVDAALFKLPAKTLGVRIERAMKDHAGQAVEWRTTYATAQRFRYVVETR